MASERQQQQRQQPRERGTPKDISLLRAKHAIFLVILVAVLSAALATLLFIYCASLPAVTTTPTNPATPSFTGFNQNGILKLVFISCLGSSSTLVAIIFGDSLTHALAFGVAVREFCVIVRYSIYGAIPSTHRYQLFS